MTNKEDTNKNPPPRMALNMRETAEALGLSYITVHRLVKRGKIRTIPSVRHKIIPMKEIERFLNSAESEYK